METRGRGVQTLREGKGEARTGSQGIGKSFLGERRVRERAFWDEMKEQQGKATEVQKKNNVSGNLPASEETAGLSLWRALPSTATGVLSFK